VNALLKERSGDNPRLILVVEDEPIIRDFVCEMLQLEGFSTVAVEDADQALIELSARSAEFDLLLTDIRMPGTMDGAGLANVSHDKWPQLPILVMSGHETPESSGVVHPVTFLRKPWTIGQMLDGVDKALGVHH
jgi:DNA-binding NtrC family response regulator